MSNRPRPDRYVARCDEGVARNAAWKALTRHEKIGVLDTRLGRGLGARRQREKLAEGS